MSGNEVAGYSLKGLVSVVTGGSSGIGQAVVQHLTSLGSTVACLDLNAGPTSNSVSNAAIDVRCDVSDTESVDSAIEVVASSFGGIDIVINNAGIGAQGTIETRADETWMKLYDVNVMGIVRVSRSALPMLRNSSNASVVNVGSIAGWSGIPDRAAYSATKGAVHALTMAMAADGIADGVRVNAVAPGTANTPWVQRLLDDRPDPEAERAALEARQPMGRLVSAEEVAAAVGYLASPAAASVTGSILAVDGGMFGLRTRPRNPQTC